jgi:hypothetical protein
VLEQIKDEWEELSQLQRGLFIGLIVNIFMLSNDVQKLKWRAR